MTWSENYLTVRQSERLFNSHTHTRGCAEISGLTYFFRKFFFYLFIFQHGRALPCKPSHITRGFSPHYIRSRKCLLPVRMRISVVRAKFSVGEIGKKVLNPACMKVQAADFWLDALIWRKKDFIFPASATVFTQNSAFGSPSKRK